MYGWCVQQKKKIQKSELWQQNEIILINEFNRRILKNISISIIHTYIHTYIHTCIVVVIVVVVIKYNFIMNVLPLPSIFVIEIILIEYNNNNNNNNWFLYAYLIHNATNTCNFNPATHTSICMQCTRIILITTTTIASSIQYNTIVNAF